MGQKVHPYGFRLGFNKTWRSRWFADKDYAKLLHEDIEAARRAEDAVRARRRGAHRHRAGGQQAEDRHPHVAARASSSAARARKSTSCGRSCRRRRAARCSSTSSRSRSPSSTRSSSASRWRCSSRSAWRSAARCARPSSRRCGSARAASRCACPGRLNGAEIARSEWYLHGQLPLQTLRADIDYGFAEAFTTYGAIGVKVWLYKGERLTPQDRARRRIPAAAARGAGGGGA